MSTRDELTELVQDFGADLAGALPDPEAESGQPVERFNQTLLLIEKAAGERLDDHDR